MIPGRARTGQAGACCSNNKEDSMKRSARMFGLMVVLASVILAGCATPERRAALAPETACNGLANVTVSGITLSPSSIDLDPDPVCINFNAGQAVIRWTFAQAGYVFPADAITFKSTPPSYTGAVVGSGRGYQIEINRSSGAPWPYTIKFQSSSIPPLTWTCDPTIINRDTLVFTSATISCKTELTVP
jgi:hypothetical protein